MRPLSFPIETDGDGPRFLAIARAVSDAIASGRLRPGDALPGSRELARAAGVNRNTVLAALSELKLEGWIETTETRGTFVSRELPDRAPKALRGMPRARRDDAKPAFDVRGAQPSEAARGLYAGLAPVRAPYPLLGGIPDAREVPHAEIARAFRRAAKSGDSLGYGDLRGDASLRRALSALLAQTRGVVASEDGIVVTRGSQMALYLAARSMLAPGDAVAVEAYGYRPAWEAFRLAGAELVPVPVDGEGMRVDALAELT
jgi:GntR family transcriptional regulator/MocR family aminotransferase